MPNYMSSVIYNMWYNDNLLYIGSTTNFTKRKSQYKFFIKTENLKNKKFIHKKINELNIPFENLRFEIYEKYPCKCKSELFKREGEIIRELQPLYNYFYKVDTKLKKREYDIERRSNNNKLYTCPCGSEIKSYKLCDHLKTKKHLKFINK